MTYLAVQVGAAGGSAHGGASPPAYSAGSGCPPGPKARASPGRLLRFLPLPSPSLRPVLSGSLHFVALRFLPLPSPSLRPVLSGSLHFAHLLLQGRFPPLRVLRFLPLPSPSLRPVLSGSLHDPIQVPPRISPPLFPRVSLRFLPLPSPSLRPVLSGSLHFVPHTASGFVLLPLPRVSPRDGSSASVVFSPSFPFLASSSFQFGYVFLSFPSASSCFLPLPSLSFRPGLSGSLHSRPLRSPAVFPPTRRSDSFPVLLPDPGFRRPSFGARFLWPAGRAEAPPHHSTGAAKVTGMVQTLKSLLYPSFEASQSTGNRGLMVLTSCENQALWSCLRRSIRRLRRSSSDAVSDDSSARLAKTPASIK